MNLWYATKKSPFSRKWVVIRKDNMGHIVDSGLKFNNMEKAVEYAELLNRKLLIEYQLMNRNNNIL